MGLNDGLRVVGLEVGGIRTAGRADAVDVAAEGRRVQRIVEEGEPGVADLLVQVEKRAEPRGEDGGVERQGGDYRAGVQQRSEIRDEEVGRADRAGEVGIAEVAELQPHPGDVRAWCSTSAIRAWSWQGPAIRRYSSLARAGGEGRDEVGDLLVGPDQAGGAGQVRGLGNAVPGSNRLRIAGVGVVVAVVGMRDCLEARAANVGDCVPDLGAVCKATW